MEASDWQEACVCKTRGLHGAFLCQYLTCKGDTREWLQMHVTRVEAGVQCIKIKTCTETWEQWRKFGYRNEVM